MEVNTRTENLGVRLRGEDEGNEGLELVGLEPRVALESVAPQVVADAGPDDAVVQDPRVDPLEVRPHPPGHVLDRLFPSRLHAVLQSQKVLLGGTDDVFHVIERQVALLTLDEGEVLVQSPNAFFRKNDPLLKQAAVLADLFLDQAFELPEVVLFELLEMFQQLPSA